MIITAVLLVNSAIALTCSADNLNKPGTCIKDTFKLFGRSIYKACYFDPYYSDGSLWSGYTLCYATIRKGNLVSDAGSLVADAYTTNQHQLVECHYYNGAKCDVYTTNGFTSSDSASDRGYCDASSSNCVKCNSNHVEIKKWTGGGWIIGTGNNKCESGCGASSACDEKSPDSYSGHCMNTYFEGYCNSNCLEVQGTCESSCSSKVSQECDEKYPGNVCASDYCERGQLIDYNDNGIKDNVKCTSTCGCDTTYNPPVCSTQCAGTSTECNGKPQGYNTGNAGCDDECHWLNCGNYAWHDKECYTSCSGNNECYSPAVCDLAGDDLHKCVIDTEVPVVTITYPHDNPLINGTFYVNFTISDNTDPVLQCYYSLNNGSPKDLGNFPLGKNSASISVESKATLQTINISCKDDSGNEGLSNKEGFYYDNIVPHYNETGWTNLTVLHNDLITFLDSLNLFAHWFDNTGLNWSVLWTNRSGEWLPENTSPFNGSPEAWSNFTLDLSNDGNKTIAWKIIANDSFNNVNETTEGSFYVWNATKDFSVKINTLTGELNFTANGQLTFGAPPINSSRTNSTGDMTITHEGVGLPIDVKFWLTDPLPSDFTMKMGETPNYNDAVTLTTSGQTICHHIQPGDKCQVWVWLDWSGNASPGRIDGNFKAESYFSN